MDFTLIDNEVDILKKEANSCKVDSELTLESAKGNSIICSRMRIELMKMVDAMEDACKIFNKKIDAYRKSNPIGLPLKQPAAAPIVKQPELPKEEEPKPALSKIGLSLDDFDEEPPSTETEMAIEIDKTLKSLF